MSADDVDISSLNRLTYDLASAPGILGARTALVVRKAAHDIEATAKSFAPVDTGALRSSIGVDFDGDGRGQEMTATIGPSVDYAPYVEFGTSRHAPAAFMGPALDRHSADFEAALGMATDRLL